MQDVTRASEGRAARAGRKFRAHRARKKQLGNVFEKKCHSNFAVKHFFLHTGVAVESYHAVAVSQRELTIDPRKYSDLE